jgi:hypothetical protein
MNIASRFAATVKAKQDGKEPSRNVPVVACEPIRNSSHLNTPQNAPFRSHAAHSLADYDQICQEVTGRLVEFSRRLMADHVAKYRAASSLTSPAAASSASSAATGAGSATPATWPPDITPLIDLLTTQDMQQLNAIEVAMQRARRVENNLPRYRELAEEYRRVAEERMRANVATHKPNQTGDMQ